MAEKKPIIIAVDDDVQVLRAIVRDLRKEYGSSYRIVSSDKALDMLDALRELKMKGEVVALFLSDQKMPEIEGVEFLEEAMDIFPAAGRVLLTAYSDTDAAIKAINEVQLDNYLMKPWNPPEEKLFPVITDLLEEWEENSYDPREQGIKLIGYAFSANAHKIKDFLAGNLIPYLWLETTDARAEDWLETLELNSPEYPLVILEDGKVLEKPSITELATAVGLQSTASRDIYDVVIIGAGPAGLAAAVYGGSEGLNTLLIERRAPGGQAGTSTRIENYLGFPKGLSGADLSRRAQSQALRFGVEMLNPQEVVEIQLKSQLKVLKLIDGSEVITRSVVITTGVDYRKLEAPGLEGLSGAGVYYGAATTEANSCSNQDVYIVGGGNSAGQAAMYLSRFARKVYIVIRKKDLRATMSSYLIDQLDETENIEVLGETVIAAAKGESHLESLIIDDIKGGQEREVSAGGLFIFIGAKPYTDWLGELIPTDTRGFVITGRDLLNTEGFSKAWKEHRDPYALETGIPGIFAAGDVRSGAMNRVASAVGEGAMSISFVHRYLAEN